MGSGRLRRTSKSTISIAILLAMVASLFAAWWLHRSSGDAEGATAGSPGRPLTFHQDIAPLVYAHCSPCHRPGEPAPFALLNYSDVLKRAQQIAEVTRRRIMPPWLPEPGPYPLEGDRSLTPQQIALIQSWVEQGAPEGSSSPATASPPIAKKSDWQLGQPDLVVTMPEAYAVAADGDDAYRNFVVPIQNRERRYVRAIEFNPGNGRVVHHAFLLLDSTRESRRSDEAEPGPGFDGLHTSRSAQPPEGHFLSWQPGKRAMAEAGGFAWALERDSDLVLQIHLRPTGRAERLQASVGFYFTNQPPSRTPFKLGMKSFTIAIPPGAEAHWVRDQFEIPVDVDVLSILPHAHYLARELHAEAKLPDGRELSLLSIGRWDFNWQGDYNYRQPVFLPKGSAVSMRYRYDNSTNNPSNPNHPPRLVNYGLRSTDEMAELWLLVLPRKPEELPRLADSYRPRVLSEAMLYNRYLLNLNPKNARAIAEIGKVHFARQELAEARDHFQRAVALEPNLDDPHYFLGLIFRVEGDPPAARAAFQRAIELNPFNAKAHGNLGLIAAETGARDEARRHFREALRLNPDDDLARKSLQELGP